MTFDNSNHTHAHTHTNTHTHNYYYFFTKVLGERISGESTFKNMKIRLQSAAAT